MGCAVGGGGQELYDRPCMCHAMRGYINNLPFVLRSSLNSGSFLTILRSSRDLVF